MTKEDIDVLVKEGIAGLAIGAHARGVTDNEDQMYFLKGVIKYISDTIEEYESNHQH